MMKIAQGNDRFAFVNTEVKTENEDGNFVSDPIDLSGNIYIKEEIDLNWEECSVDENQCELSDKLKDLVNDVVPNNNVLYYMNDPLAETDGIVANDPLAESNSSVTIEPQVEKTCSIKHCIKYKIHPIWLEHCYSCNLYSKCENCPQNYNEPSICPDCGKQFNNQNGLVMHILTCKDYKCDRCNLKFCRKFRFVNHMRKHQNSSVCKNCHKIFEDDPSLDLHLLDCTVYKCDSCFYQTFNKVNIRTHIFKIHMKKNGETIPFDLTYHNPTLCPRCGKMYKNKNVIKSHLTYCQKKMLNCLYCKFETQRFSILKRHVQSLHIKNKSFIVCSRCGKILENKLSLKDHYFVCPQKALSCNYCPFQTKYSLCLKIHLFKLHCQTNQTKFECLKCFKKSEDHTSFRSHLQMCLKSPDMQCDLCNYTTNHPANLSDHVFQDHFNIRRTCRMPCPNCGKMFMSLNSWKRHKSICERPLNNRKRRRNM